MVYSNKFVLVVLRKGRPQKELANGVVKIPFGEYALRFRNKHTRRAVVKFFIDGENVSGDGYIIPANGHADIDCYHATRNKFKFVSLDSEDAVDFGKNGPNEDKIKGTIEARFFLERESKPFVSPSWPIIHEEHHHHHYPKKYTYDPYRIDNSWDYKTYGSWDYRYNTHPVTTTHTKCSSNMSTPLRNEATPLSDTMVGLSSLGATIHSQSQTTFDSCILKDAEASSTLSFNESTPVQDGCTVEGSRSNQQFIKEWIDYDTENYVSLRVFLQGYEAPEEVEEAPKQVAPDYRKPTRSKRKLTELEEENERLRQLLAEKENAELKAKLGINKFLKG